MSNHSIVKAGLGIGLMAASLSATAELHSFAEPMMFYKVNGSAVNYVAFIPSMAGLSAGALYLELYQSGTISTWAYGLAGSVVDSVNAGPSWSFTASNSTQSDNDQSFTVKYYDVLGNSSGSNWGSTSSGASQGFSSLWYGGGTNSLTQSVTQQLTYSSQACNVSFVASIGTDDYLQFNGFTIRPSDWPTASDSVSYRTKSGTTASDTASVGSAAWNASNFSATGALYTFSAYSIPNAAAAGNTVAASSLTKANLCTNAYTAKNALNTAGGTIGAKTGLMRLW